MENLEEGIKSLSSYCEMRTGTPIANELIREYLRQDQEETINARDNDIIDEDVSADILKGYREKEKWLNALLELADDLSLEREFLLIPQNKFSSSFKQTLGTIPIVFPNLIDRDVELGEVVDILNAENNRKSNFFHMFYKQRNKIDTIEKKEIVDKISSKLRNIAQN